MRIPDQTFMFAESQRVIVWFSCGAASAVALDLALKKYPRERVEAIYCDTSQDENKDNIRFRADVEKWLGVTIKVIGSKKYSTCDEVYRDTKYICGHSGARCTTELKKKPRIDYQQPEDIHIFGYTADETAPFRKPSKDRVLKFENNNPELFLDWVLVDSEITKAKCYKILMAAGIALPIKYAQGFRNNNCDGCCKSDSPGYWQMVRIHTPEVFKQRAETSRLLGVRLVKIGKIRIFLDELEDKPWKYKREDISCGPECGGGK